MSIHRFDSTQTLPVDLDTAWRFFSNPRNLREITPPWLGFEVTSDVPEEMYAGLIVTYKVRPLFNLALSWVTEITHVVDRRMFVDEQRMGPYQFWHHQHHFREVPSGVEIRDIVHYAVPGGPIGDLIAKLTVAPKVREIFRHRRSYMARHYAGAST